MNRLLAVALPSCHAAPVEELLEKEPSTVWATYQISGALEEKRFLAALNGATTRLTQAKCPERLLAHSAALGPLEPDRGSNTVDASPTLPGIGQEHNEAESDRCIKAFWFREDDSFQLTLLSSFVDIDLMALDELACQVVELYAPLKPESPSPTNKSITQSMDKRGSSRALLDRQFDDWERSLQCPSIPVDRIAQIKRTMGNCASFTLSGELEELEKQLGFHQASIFLATWLLLLARLSDVSGIATGAILSHSGLSGLGRENRIIPVRADVDGRLSFAAYVHQVNDQLVDAIQRCWNLDLPLPQDAAGSQNTFPTAIEFIDRRWRYEASSLTITPHSCSKNGVEQPVGVRLLRFSSETTIILKWGASSSDVAEYVLNLLCRLLHSCSAASDGLLAQLSLTPSSERRFFSSEVESGLESGVSVVEAIRAAAMRNGEEVAVRFGQEEITYAELMDRMERLAHYLRSFGAGGEARIGLLLERSIDMVVAVLAVLRSGGAYVPLNPRDPDLRRSRIIVDAGISIVVTHSCLRSMVPDSIDAVVCLDAQKSEIASFPTAEGIDCPVADALAYILYTSGSTGTPKGVMVSHRGLSNYLHWAREAYRIEDGVGAPVHSSLGFDLTITSLLGPLVAGRTTYLLPEDDPVEHLAEAVKSGKRFSLIKITPAHLQLLAERLGSDPDLIAVGALVIGGEELRAEQLDYWRIHAPGTRIINEYGPTETVVGCSIYELLPDDERTGLVPIGRPIANSRLYLLDRYLHLAPAEVTAEIYIGGPGVARGYCNDPALTAEKFVPDHFAEIPGARMYRTGDLGRYRLDGTIEFLGRRDMQVKLRGFRIELGEIESALAQHDSIREARVTMRDSAAGAKRLIAYIVPSRGPALPPDEIRTFLASRLPDYMIPAAFVALEALPLTQNGKVDIGALPMPNPASSGARTLYVPPRTDTEKILADIWQQCLQIDQIGIHENFFELGGDSILSIQVAAKAKKAGLNLTVKDIFKYQTIAEQSTHLISGTMCEASTTSVPGIPLLPHEAALLSVPEGESKQHFHRAVFSLADDFSVLTFKNIVQSLFDDLSALRLRLQSDGGLPQQQIASSAPDMSVTAVPLNQIGNIDSSAAYEQQFKELGMLLDPLHGTHLAAQIVSVSNGKSLLLVGSALVLDASSWRRVLALIVRRYNEGMKAQSYLRSGPSDDLILVRCAQEIYDLANSESIDAALEYWIAIIDRARDFKSPHLEGLEWRTFNFSLDEATTTALITRVLPALRITLEELIAATLTHSLRKIYGTEHILVSLQENLAPADTIGPFSYTYPFAPPLATTYSPAFLLAFHDSLTEIAQKGLSFAAARFFAASRFTRAALMSLPKPLAHIHTEQDRFVPGDLTRQPTPLSVRDIAFSQVNDAQLVSAHQWVQGGSLHCRWLVRQVETLPDGPQAFIDEFVTALSYLARSEREWPKQLTDVYPVTPTQEGMLFHSVSHPGSDLYTERLVATIKGQFDYLCFEQAWSRLTSRHAALRTTFLPSREGKYEQYVSDSPDACITLKDLEMLHADERNTTTNDYLRQDRLRVFSLQHGPLVRVAVLRQAQDDHSVILTFHHAILDGWSLQIILNELFQFYRGLNSEHDIDLPAPPAFGEFARWTDKPATANEVAYWTETLASHEHSTSLAGYLRAQVGSERPDPLSDCSTILEPEMVSCLNRLARQYKITASSVLLGTWALLLHICTNECNVLFGMTHSGRSAPIEQCENIIGLLINTVPVTAEVIGDSSLIDWLSRFSSARASANPYEHTPLAAIRRWSSIPPGEPLIASLVVVENYPRMLDSSPFTLSDLHIDDSTEVPVLLVVTPGDTWHLRLSVQVNDVSGAQVRNLLNDYVAILNSVISYPDQTISSLRAEFHDAMTTEIAGTDEWASQEDRFPPDVGLHDVFARVASQQSQRCAIRYAGRAITYGELDARSTAVAMSLRSYGCGNETPVALLLEPSIEMIVSMLGVLKSGGFYVPIQTGTPDSRVRYIIEDTGATLMITDLDPHDLLPIGVLAASPSELESRNGQSTPCDVKLVSSEQLAYIIYTSGSTGLPKGVMVSHASVLALLRSARAHFRFTSSDVWTMFHSYAFDFSVWEVFGALLTGSSLIIVQRTSRDPSAFSRLLSEEHVSVLNLTPTALRHFHLNDKAFASELRHPGLRWIILGGERLDIEGLAELILQLPSKCQLINMYGITETTVHVTFRLINAADLQHAKSSRIGQPLRGLRIRLISSEFSSTESDTYGEIFVSGDQLARGYWHRPDLTAERFLPNPLSSDMGGRFYRSGDLARSLGDEGFEYQGRLDHQLKINGYRIETSEIEHALLEWPNVKEAAVILDRTRLADGTLIAFYIADKETPSHTLKMHLAQSLPVYMIPSDFVRMAMFPLTVNGKLDRDRLLREASALRSVSRIGADSAGSVEEHLRRIWQDVLGVGTIDVQDNFFALGGDSILSLQISARLHNLGFDVSPAAVFEHPTIAELGGVVSLLPIPDAQLTKGNEGNIIPLTPIQKWFFSLKIPNRSHWNQAVMIRLAEGVAPGRLEVALNTVVSRHPALHYRFHIDDDTRRWVQLSAPPTQIHLCIIDLAAAPQSVQESLLLDCIGGIHRSLDLQCGPIVQFAYIRAGRQQPPRLFGVAHHLVVDSVSWRILIDDIRTTYNVKDGDVNAPLRQRASFADWAHFIEGINNPATPVSQGWECSDVANAQGAPGSEITKPLRNTEGSAQHLLVQLDEFKTRRFRARAQELPGVQTSDALLAVQALAWHQWSKKDQLRVLVERHGRDLFIDRFDLSRTVGWFTVFIPVLLDFNVLRGTEGTARSIREQSDASYAKMRRAPVESSVPLDYSLELRDSGVPTIAFNYLGQLDSLASSHTDFQLVRAALEPQRDPLAIRPITLEFSAAIIERQLLSDITYSASLFEQRSMLALQRYLTDSLDEFISE